MRDAQPRISGGEGHRAGAARYLGPHVRWQFGYGHEEDSGEELSPEVPRLGRIRRHRYVAPVSALSMSEIGGARWSPYRSASSRVRRA